VAFCGQVEAAKSVITQRIRTTLKQHRQSPRNVIIRLNIANSMKSTATRIHWN